MNLCFVNPFFYPSWGGREKHLFEITKRLAKTDNVHILTARLNGSSPEEQIEGVKVHRIPSKTYDVPLLSPPPLVISPRFKKKLRTLDTCYQFDAIALHDRFTPEYTYSLKYATEKNIFSTFTMHDQGVIDRTASSKNKKISLNFEVPLDKIYSAYNGLYGMNVVDNAEKVIAVSKSVSKDLEVWGIDKNKIELIYNGVDTSFYRPSKKTYKEKYGKGFDNMLVFSGRFVVQKGIQYLLKALPDILKQHPSTKLLIVGKGSFERFLRYLIKKNGLEKNVEFTGFIPEADLPNMYSSADVYVAPSLVEPFGLVVAEAMSCGVPVVASDVGGIPEVIGDSGLIFEPANSKQLAEKVNYLLSNPDIRKKLSRKARKRMEDNFDWDIITEQTRNFYKNNI